MNRQRTNFGVGGWEIAPVGVVAGLLTGLLTGLACGQQYTVTDLGTLGGPSLTGYPGSQAYGLNDAGEVCGMSVLANDVGDLHAFRWDGAMTELLPTGGDPLSTAFAINSSGQVVGISHTLGAIETTAVRWTARHRSFSATSPRTTSATWASWSVRCPLIQRASSPTRSVGRMEP